MIRASWVRFNRRNSQPLSFADISVTATEVDSPIVRRFRLCDITYTKKNIVLSHFLAWSRLISSSFLSSWIIDPGSSIHPCYNTAKHRYKPERSGLKDEKIAAGSSLLHVESIGSIIIKLNA